MNSTEMDRLALDLDEASLLYVRLKREEDGLKIAELNLLHKLEAFLYGFLSIEDLELLVGERKDGRR
jgi:hypothetical protein